MITIRTLVADFSLTMNHAESVVRTPVGAFALSSNHAEGVVGR